MREAYAAAEFSHAGRLYDEHAFSAQELPGDIVLMRARIALSSDPAAAVDVVLRERPRIDRPADRVAAEIVLGESFARLFEFSAADAHFERARFLADRRSFSQAAALSAARGRRYVLESRIGDAWRCYEATLVDRSLEGRIESERLKGEIHGAETRYGEHAESVMRLLALIGSEIDTHLTVWYPAVADLARLACELPAPNAARTAADALAARPAWPQDFATHRFVALRSLAWYKALAGDSLGSFRHLRDAGALAETLANAALRAIVLLDRAQLARDAGEENWCANELAAAGDQLHDFDWARAGAQERIALLLFAEVLAPTDPEGATAAVARFFKLERSTEPIATATRGMVHLASGRTREAVRDLQSAYDAFNRAGSDWRAGRAALALARATRIERWRLLALEKLEFYANSHLFAQAQAVALPPDPSDNATLTPMQERVFNMICEGLSTDAIAKRLGRSRSTVRNHLKLVFKALGVRSRAALVAKAARSGRFNEGESSHP
jgi:DNA-binding CsgD family transcriptional regulator